MVNNNYFLISIVVVILIILLWIWDRNRIKKQTELYYQSNLLEGMWVSSEGFENESGIDKMLFYLGNNTNDNTRDGYLILQINGETVENSKLNIKFMNQRKEDKYHVYDLVIKGDDLNGIPNELVLKLDVANGACALHDNEILYGEFFKDNSLSAIAKNLD